MADLDALLGDLATATGEAHWRARFAVREAVFAAGAPGAEPAPAEAGSALLAAIEAASTPLAVRLWLLGLVATLAADDIVVPRLATLLDNDVLQDAARLALERINNAPARRALARFLLTAARPEIRAAVAAALGQIGDGEAKALLMALGDPQLEVRLAAAESLARFPYPELDRVLAHVATDDNESAEVRVQRARLRLAKTLARSGQGVMAYRVRRDVMRTAKKPWIQRDAERDLR